MLKSLLAAQALITARKEKRPLTKFPEKAEPMNVSEALAIQDAVFDVTGRSVGAWKVGPPTIGFPPTSAMIAEENIFYSPAQLSADLPLKAIECEIAFRLACDLPVTRIPYEDEDIKSSIAAVMVAIEAVETRYGVWPVTNPIWALADCQSNEALVIGTEVPFSEFERLGDLTMTLQLGGSFKTVKNGFPGANPFALISWLANHLVERSPYIVSRGLKKGDIITTGSWTGVDFAAANLSLRATCGPLGFAELKYV